MIDFFVLDFNYSLFELYYRFKKIDHNSAPLLLENQALEFGSCQIRKQGTCLVTLA